MAWLSVSFEVAAPRVEAVSDALLEAGALSVEVTDADTGSSGGQWIFDEAGTHSGARGWSRSRVSALLREDADPAALVAYACAQAGLAPPSHEIRRVADEDWVRAARAQFGPVRISPRLWIVPSWSAAPDPGAISIVLDPGLAFGTGGHPTTRQCLRWLERTVGGGESVIDYGCGSGVLAIAALKLGAARAAGVDIDEQALLAARRNAMQNRVEATFHRAAEVFARPADIVIANILARPLVVLAPLLARLTAPHGRLALAGMLAGQAQEVCAAYRDWFEIGPEAEDEGWMLLAGRRRAERPR